MILGIKGIKYYIEFALGNQPFIKKYRVFYPNKFLIYGNNFQKTRMYCNKTLNRHYEICCKCDDNNNANNNAKEVFIICSSIMHLMFNISNCNYQSIRFH